jgi:Protein of unknown function (DUF4238)
MLLDSMARPADWPAPVYDVPLAQAMHDIGAGRRQWPSNPEKTRHHFVPRFILDSYATSEGATTRRLAQLDKTTGRALKVLPEEAASRRRFYAVESDESPRDNRIEDFLSLVEGYAAGPIRTLLERPMELTEADRTTIALMLALQERWTPFGIAEAGKAVEQLGREQMATLARDPSAFAEMWRKSAPDRSSPADIEAETFERVRRSFAEPYPSTPRAKSGIRRVWRTQPDRREPQIRIRKPTRAVRPARWAGLPTT